MRTTPASSRSPSRSARNWFARRPSVLPDVTVESLRMGEDKSLARFNIRTTEQNPEQGQERDPRVRSGPAWPGSR